MKFSIPSHQLLEKLEKWVFYLFLFCIPFQTRVILFQWTRPFNEWTAAFLYASDIIFAAVLILWTIRKLRFTKLKFEKNTALIFLGLFFIISAVSIFRAGIFGLAIFRLIKLAEFIFLFLYIKYNVRKIFSFETAMTAVVASGFFQAIIAIVQYTKQGSVGLKIFGESHITPEIYNVAVFIGSDNIKYMRSYGTFPHPNVLAAFLVLSLFAFYFLYYSKKQILQNDRSAKLENLFLLFYSIIVFGLLFTFSRTMIGIWGLSSVILFFVIKKYRKIFAPMAITTIAVGILFAILFWPQTSSRIHISSDEEAVTQRILYNEIAGEVIKSNPIFGVGIGQSVFDLIRRFRYYPQYFYQPTHNIYLLISSETGFVGLLLFLLFLGFLFWKSLKSKYQTWLLFLVACSFLLMGLFDHFFWTLQQGSFVFWLALAILTV